MENTTQMENTTPSTPNSGGARGAFLTVICILTFIGSGAGIIGSIVSYATANTVSSINSEAISNAQTQIDNDQNAPSFVKQIMGSVSNLTTPETIKKSALLKLVSTLLTLFGAIMMFMQKKTGFYLYVAGILIYILSPLFVASGLIAAMGVFFAALIGVAFTVMYAVNLKYMTK